MWFWFALGSAVFAVLTSIFAKIGIEGVSTNLATAIRTIVITLIFAFIFLKEKLTIKSLIGCVLIGAGTLLIVI